MKRDWKEQLRAGVPPEDIDLNAEAEKPRLTRERKRDKRQPNEGIRRHQPGTLPPVEDA